MNGKREGPACRPPTEKVIMPIWAGSRLRRLCCRTEPVRALGHLCTGSRRCEAQPVRPPLVEMAFFVFSFSAFINARNRTASSLSAAALFSSHFFSSYKTSHQLIKLLFTVFLTTGVLFIGP